MDYCCEASFPSSLQWEQAAYSENRYSSTNLRATPSIFVRIHTPFVPLLALKLFRQLDDECIKGPLQ